MGSNPTRTDNFNMIQDKQNTIKKLYDWMENFLEIPRESLGGWALCPFAKKARLKNRIHISFIDWSNLDKEIELSINALKEKEVGALLFDPSEMNNTELQKYINDKLNPRLMKNNHIVIVDHPEEKETLKGLSTHFGEAGIILVFELDKLNKATMYLKSEGYFNPVS